MKLNSRKDSRIGFFTLLVAFALCFNKAQATPIVGMEVNDQQILAGEILTVDLHAYDDTNEISAGWVDEVISFGFQLSYDKAALYFYGASAGPGFDVLDAFLPADVIGLSSPYVENSGSDIQLARLVFTALAPGEFSVAIFSDLSDPNQGLSTFLHGGDNRISINTSLEFQISEPVTPSRNRHHSAVSGRTIEFGGVEPAAEGKV